MFEPALTHSLQQTLMTEEKAPRLKIVSLLYRLRLFSLESKWLNRQRKQSLVVLLASVCQFCIFSVRLHFCSTENSLGLDKWRGGLISLATFRY